MMGILVPSVFAAARAKLEKQKNPAGQKLSGGIDLGTRRRLIWNLVSLPTSPSSRISLVLCLSDSVQAMVDLILTIMHENASVKKMTFKFMNWKVNVVRTPPYPNHELSGDVYICS